MKHHSYYSIVAVPAILALVALLFYGGWTPTDNTRGSELQIVSLSPSVTEILFALGLQDCIAGVTECCDWPAEVKNIECVGGFGTPNVEKLLALCPDIVIATDFKRNDIAAVLEKSGIKVLELKIGNFEEMFEAIQQIGQATGKPQAAEKIVDAMQAELKDISERFREIPAARRSKVFVEIWYDPITTVGRTSFIDEVIRLAGGINVAGNISQAWPRVNPEKVIEWDPDVIVLCYMANKVHSSSQLAGRIGWADISAVRNGRIISDILPEIILRPGPRIVEGVRVLAQRFNEGAVQKAAVCNKNQRLILAEKVQ